MHPVSRQTLKGLGASEAHIRKYEAAKQAQPCGACRAGLTHEHEVMKCDTCGITLDADKGEAFLTDDGGVFCNDHYIWADDCPSHVSQPFATLLPSHPDQVCPMCGLR